MRMRSSLAIALLATLTLGLALASPASARTPESKLFVDKMHGQTTIWVPWEYYDTRIAGQWGNMICIAPGFNVNLMRCDQLDLIDFYEDANGNFWVKLSYAMVTGQGIFGLYPYRGYNHGFWFGLPCGGGYIQNFVYPSSPSYPIDFELNISTLPAGNIDIC